MLQGSEYPSNLTEQQWDLIKDLIPKSRAGGRPRTTDPRTIINAVLYIVRTGSAWRYLPKTFPPWKTVHDYFCKWNALGLWAEINFILAIKVRCQSGRDPVPTIAIVDSQTVRSHYGDNRGYDAIKKARGRKRNILVDTLGMIWSCEVHAGNIIDAQGGLNALNKMPRVVQQRITKIIGDSVYRWPLDYFAKKIYGIDVEIISKKIHGSNMRSNRWVVERTFAWFNHFRRLTRDYERLSRNAEAMIYIAMTSIMLRRLAP